jgi:prepilin-type N-terminal cleavage/methylation domain-containing protein
MTVQQAKRKTGGFTMIELLVVVLIISVLIALGLAVGARVVEGGKASQTRDLLKVMDNALNSYLQATDRKAPPAAILDPRLPEGAISGTIVYMPMADAQNRENGLRINSVGLFLAEARRVPDVEQILEGVDAKNYRLFAYTDAASLVANPGAHEPELMTVIDAWGNPIRYVHPAFHGVLNDWVDVEDLIGPPETGAYFPQEIRRSPAGKDADGGMTTVGRGYFYSAGPDGDPSTVEDNIYTAEPKIQS